MGLILRVDVDKPFGHKTLLNKVKSKLFEDYINFSPSFLKGYLNHLKEFITFCNEHQVSGTFYFRMCTLPHSQINDLLKLGGHRIGIHAENTKSLETITSEFEEFKKYTKSSTIDSFTKHGSGNLKLGKNHYAPYEPEKYIEWSKALNLKYHSGNGIPHKKEDLISNSKGFLENVFWLEKEYRDPNFNKLEDVIDMAKENDVVVLIHPSNFQTFADVKHEFETLIQLAKKNNINWVFCNL